AHGHRRGHLGRRPPPRLPARLAAGHDRRHRRALRPRHPRTAQRARAGHRPDPRRALPPGGAQGRRAGGTGGYGEGVTADRTSSETPEVPEIPEPPVTRDDLAVLMTVYHRVDQRHLSEALESLWAQTVRAGRVVLVSDGPLTPGLDAVIERHAADHPELDYRPQAENRGS